jgi:hypothetical protein
MSVLPVGIGDSGGYQTQCSLRFRASASASISRTTPASGGDRDKSWVYFNFKRSTLGVLQYLHGADTASVDAIYFNASDKLCVDIAGTNRLISKQVFRDPTAHGAFFAVMDATNATAALKYRVYHWGNGGGTFAEITAWDTDTRSGITSGTAKTMHNSIAHVFGKNPTAASNYADGYLSEHRIGTWSGSAPTPASFGGISAITGLWEQRGNSASYGTSGSYLDFSDPTSTTTLCADRSGNGNNWTANNISLTAGSTYDSMLDVPLGGGGSERGNYATLNPLDGAGSGISLLDGNLKASWAGGANRNCFGSWTQDTGKLYLECLQLNNPSNNLVVGFCGTNIGSGTVGITGQSPLFGYGYDGRSFFGSGSSGSGGTTLTVGTEVMRWAVDFDAGKAWVGGASGWFGGGNPSAGTSPFFTFTPNTAMKFFGTIFSADFVINAGQRPFAYTPPTGFKALHTGNLTNTTPTSSGSFTGNLSADGPFIWCNGTPETLTINGNAVTWGTHADKLANGFKLRTASSSYNSSGTNTWTATLLSPSSKSAFKYQNAKGNP